MRVLHLSTSDVKGGAARGAYWLHKALQSRDVDSLMLVDRKYSNDRCVVSESGIVARLHGHLRGALDQLPLRRYQKTDDSYWTVGWVPHKIDRLVQAVAPDIVHIHWTGGGFLPIEALTRLRYPLVWTLRDMWAFTGGCHYSVGCVRYSQACGTCPQLRSEHESDLSRRMWKRKRSAWHGLNVWLVPISNWLAQCVRDSAMFDEPKIEVIPNGLHADQFRPFDKRIARTRWGLIPDRRYILYGAIGALRDPRKGFSHLVAALGQLAQNGWDKRADVIVFGDIPRDALPDLGFRTHFVGQLSDDERLALLYASADVMVGPSVQEAFGKTIIEAMACGTPVVAFDAGGPAEIVDHRKTGYLARPFISSDLARGIAWCLSEPERPIALGQRARAKVEAEFDITAVADRYRALYSRVLEASHQ